MAGYIPTLHLFRRVHGGKLYHATFLRPREAVVYIITYGDLIERM